MNEPLEFPQWQIGRKYVGRLKGKLTCSLDRKVYCGAGLVPTFQSIPR